MSLFVYKSHPSASVAVVRCSAQCRTAHARLLLHNRAWSPVRHWCQYGDPASESAPAPPWALSTPPPPPCHLSCLSVQTSLRLHRHRGISEDAALTFGCKTQSTSNMSTLWDRTKTLSQEQFEPIQAVSDEDKPILNLIFPSRPKLKSLKF